MTPKTGLGQVRLACEQAVLLLEEKIVKSTSILTLRKLLLK